VFNTRVVDSKQHREDERSVIARLAGVARRHASLRHAQPGSCDAAAAVAELHQISTDAHPAGPRHDVPPGLLLRRDP